MPPYCVACSGLHVSTLLDRTDDTLDPEIHFSTRIDVNGSILMKLWLSEVRYCDGEFWSKTSPSHNFINIMILSTYYAYKCRYYIDILSWKARRQNNNVVGFNNTKNKRGQLIPAPNFSTLELHQYMAIDGIFCTLLQIIISSSYDQVDVVSREENRIHIPFIMRRQCDEFYPKPRMFIAM
jgi:hypothetical protein